MSTAGGRGSSRSASTTRMPPARARPRRARYPFERFPARPFAPTMGVMGRSAAVAAVVLAVMAATAFAQPSATNVTAAQLTSTFKRLNGDKLVANKKMSYPGHYRAFDAGPISIAKKGKYGQFT